MPCKTPHYCFFLMSCYFNENDCSETLLRTNIQKTWEYFFFILFWKDKKKKKKKKRCFTYLKYGPYRPESRLAVGVKIQTENATHLVSRAEHAPQIFQQPQSRKKKEKKKREKKISLKTSSNSVCVLIGKNAETPHQVCFSYSDPAPRPKHASFHTLESKGRCWRERTECHCASRGTVAGAD